MTSLETCLLLRMSGLLSHSRGCVNILIEKGCEKKHGGHLKPKRYGRLGRILSWFQILFIEPHRFCFGGVLMFSRLCSREHRTQGCEVSLAYNHVFGFMVALFEFTNPDRTASCEYCKILINLFSLFQSFS